MRCRLGVAVFLNPLGTNRFRLQDRVKNPEKFVKNRLTREKSGPSKRPSDFRPRKSKIDKRHPACGTAHPVRLGGHRFVDAQTRPPNRQSDMVDLAVVDMSLKRQRGRSKRVEFLIDVSAFKRAGVYLNGSQKGVGSYDRQAGSGLRHCCHGRRRFSVCRAAGRVAFYRPAKCGWRLFWTTFNS